MSNESQGKELTKIVMHFDDGTTREITAGFVGWLEGIGLQAHFLNVPREAIEPILYSLSEALVENFAENHADWPEAMGVTCGECELPIVKIKDTVGYDGKPYHRWCAENKRSQKNKPESSDKSLH